MSSRSSSTTKNELENATSEAFKGKGKLGTPESVIPASSQELDVSNLEVADNDDRNLFIQIANKPRAVGQVRNLVIHLDAEDDPFQEDKLASALTVFHPQSDGTNPHLLRSITIVVSGQVLYCRYYYHLIGPPISGLSTTTLRGYYKGVVSSKGTVSGPFKVNATDKAVAQSILGIRSVPWVTVTGRGYLEAGFEATIIGTLGLAPGNSINKVSSLSTGSMYATPDLDDEGVHHSYGYMSHMATLGGYVAAEGDDEDDDEEEIEESEEEQEENGEQIEELEQEDEDEDEEEEEEEEGNASGLAMESMVQINAQHIHQADLESMGGPLTLEMGWKI